MNVHCCEGVTVEVFDTSNTVISIVVLRASGD